MVTTNNMDKAAQEMGWAKPQKQQSKPKTKAKTAPTWQPPEPIGYTNPLVKGVAEVVDTVLNRPGYAFKNAIIQEKAGDNALEQLALGAKGFMQGLTGDARPTAQDFLRAEGISVNPETLGGKAAGFAADILTNPVNLIGGGVGIATKAPTAVKIAKGAGVGAGFTGASAFGEQLPAEDVAISALMGGALGGALTGAGEGISRALSKGKAPTITEPVSLDHLFGDEPRYTAPDDFFAQWRESGEAPPPYQQAMGQRAEMVQDMQRTMNPDNPFAAIQRSLDDAEKEAALPLPRPNNFDRGVDMSALPDQYPLPDTSPQALINGALRKRAEGSRQLALPPMLDVTFAEPKAGEVATTPLVNEGKLRRSIASGVKRSMNSSDPFAETREITPADMQQGFNLKRTTPEIDNLNKEMATKLGPFRIGGKIEHAPEAMERPDMQAANTIARLFGAKDIIPVRGTNNQGIQQGRQIFLNEKMADPLMYVSKHEVIHTIEATDPKLHTSLVNDAFSFATDHSAIIKHYTKQGYKTEEVWREFNSDILSEVMDRPDFWAKVRESSPQVIQKVIDVIDELIAKFKRAVSGDQSMTKYISDLERYRDTVAPKIGGHLDNMQGERQFIDALGQQPAAKMETNFKLSPDNKAEELRNMVLAAARQGSKSGGNTPHFKEQMLKQFPQLADEAKAEDILNTVYGLGQQLRKGQASFTFGGQTVNLTRKNLQAANPLPNSQNLATGQGGVNAEAQAAIPGEYKDITGRNMFGQDIYRNTDEFLGKEVGATEQEPGSVLYDFNRAKENNIDYQTKWLDRLKEVTDQLGIGKNSKLSGLVQRYGEGGTQYFKSAPKWALNSDAGQKRFITQLERQYGQGNVEWSGDGAMVHQPYTYDDLVSEVGRVNADKVVKAAEWFKNTYKEILTDVNNARAQIYPNAEKKMAEIEARVETLKNDKETIAWINERLKSYYDLIDDISSSPKRSPERKQELVAEVEAKIEKLRNSDLYTPQGRNRMIQELEVEYEKAMRGKFVPERQDYFRHFKEMSGLSGLKNVFGSPAEISPELVGKSEFTLPKSKFHGFMQKRGWGAYKEDAVGGFLDYLPEASYSVHIDPMIGKFEGQADELATMTSNTRDANKFIEYLRLHSQDLAGKTNPLDRNAQRWLTRKGMGLISYLNNRAKGNAIRFNLSTPVIQPSNMAQGIAFAKTDAPTGFGRAILDIFSDNPVSAKSGFLKERFHAQNYRQFDTRLIDQLGKFADWLLEFSDRLGTQSVWYMAYQKGLRTKGVADPIKYADAHTRRLVAGRGIGEMPIAQKSKVVQTFLPFTLEVANMWKIQKDFVRARDFAGLVILYAALHVANSLIQNMRGDRPLLDIPDAIASAVNIMTEDNGKDTGEKTILAGGRLAGEVLSNTPGGQYAALLYPEYGFDVGGYELPTRKELFGDSDPTRFGTGILPVKAMQQPGKYLALPYGGAQVDKTLKGLESLDKGGVYNKDGNKMKYPVENSTGNTVRGVMFGSSGFKETQEYYKENRRELSEKQTKQIERSPNGQKQKRYDRLMQQRKMKSINKEITDIRKDRSLTGEEKREKIQPLMKELRQVRAGN